MGIAVSVTLIALGVILVVHHRIPSAIVPEVVGVGLALIALGLVGLGLSARFWSRWGGPVSADTPERRDSSM